MPFDVAPHTMTSATVPRPYVVTWSSEYSANYQGWKAFDGVIGGGDNAWATTNGVTSGWLAISFGRQYVVEQYAIQDRGSSAIYCPRAFTFEGYQNGRWVVLDQRRDISSWVSNEKKTFQVSVPIACSAYRLSVTEVNGGTIVIIGEMFLYGKQVDTPLPPSFPSPLGFVGKRFLGSETPTVFGPRVDAGPDQYVVSPNSLVDPLSTTLAGSSPDTVTFLWTKVWGPGTATFTDNTDPVTTVEFSAAGAYRLRLTVDDGSLTAYRDVTINIGGVVDQISQVVVEVASAPAGVQRVSQVVVEVATTTLVSNDIAQVVVEVLDGSSASTDIAQTVVEVLDGSSASTDIAQVVVETLWAYRDIAIPHIASGRVLYPPTLTYEQTLTLPFIASGVALYSPEVEGEELEIFEIVLPFIASGTVLYTPSVGAGPPQEIELPFIASGTVLYGLTVGYEQYVTGAFIGSGEVVYPPFVGPTVDELAQVVVEVAGRPPLAPQELAQLVTEILLRPHAEQELDQLAVEVLIWKGGWIDIANYEDIRLRAEDFPDGLAHANIALWTEAVGRIRSRVWNQTDSVSMGESITVFGATPTDVVIPLVLTAEEAEYRVQVTANRPNMDLFAVAQFVGGEAP